MHVAIEVETDDTRQYSGAPLRATGPDKHNDPTENMNLNATIAAALAGLLACGAASAATNEFSPLLRTKKFAEAEKLAATRLAQNPASVEAIAARVEAILGAGAPARIEEAVKLGEQCVAAHPQASACHLALGQALGTKALNNGIMSAMSYAGDIRDAFKKAVELDPRSAEARFSLLEYYIAAPGIVGGGKGKARDLAGQTAAIIPAAGQLMQAQLDIGEEQLARAEAAILAVQAGADEDIAEKQSALLARIGHLHLREKRHADSERIFGLVQKRFPDSEHGWYGQGRLQQEQGRHREAIATYERALATADLAPIHYRIAQAAQALGDKVRAAAEFNKALAGKTALAGKLREDAQAQLKLLR